jgi:hypothetical protein
MRLGFLVNGFGIGMRLGDLLSTYSERSACGCFDAPGEREATAATIPHIPNISDRERGPALNTTEPMNGAPAYRWTQLNR